MGQHPKPVTVNGITERMLDKMSNASRLVEKLLQKGYVTRSYKEEDRRACNISITEIGIEVLESTKKEMKIMEEYLSGLSKPELKQLNELLDKIRASNR